jgi:hypothetical protein
MALASRASGSSVIIQLLPGNIGDTPVTVRVADAESGKRFTVFCKTNDPPADEFLHASLEVRDEDHRIAFCQIEKRWTTNGVEFSFDVAQAYMEASKFTLIETAHSGRQPMPGFTQDWFYLRDFVTNSATAAVPPGSSTVSPDILKALPGCIKTLRPGARADQVWQQLGLAAYQHSLGGESFPTKERYWLNSNQELELVFEEPAGGDIAGHDSGDQRKLVQATLYKNGREIVASSK